MITLRTITRTSGLWRAAAILGGSLFFLLLKTALVSAVDAIVGWPAWCNYLIVTIAVTLLGWIYHSKVSFRLPLSRATLRRYLAQAIALKVLDNLLYSVFVYLLGVGLTVAVLVTGATVFVIRFGVYVKYVFSSDVELVADDAADPDRSIPRSSE